MLSRIKSWYEDLERRKRMKDLEVTVNGIKVSVNNLPYYNQVDVVKNIVKSLEEREKLLLGEVEEIRNSKEKIENIKLW